MNAIDKTTPADYKHGPFGEVIRATGPMAKLNPFRFSTKYQDDETDFLYYGYRYYNPSTGRWLGRDPFGESGFELLRKPSRKSFDAIPNLYLFVHNDAINRVDILGLCCCDATTIAKQRQDLLARYALANNYLTGRHIPRGELWGSDYSCFNENNDIGLFMSPSPSCWRCRLQELWTAVTIFGGIQRDHWIIICNPAADSGSGGASLEFDYWGNATAGGPAGQGYPLNGDSSTYPHATDCNATWTPDYDNLTAGLPPYTPPPPPQWPNPL